MSKPVDPSAKPTRGAPRGRRAASLSAESGANTRLGIQSIEVGMRLMRALLEHAFDDEPPMLKTIAREAGMPAAKAHRYLVSLLRCELVERDAVAGRYCLGPFARLMGLRALQSVDVIRLANAKLPSIRAHLRHTVAMGVWYSGVGATIISVEERHDTITIGTRVGRLMPMVNSAIGQVFGAWLPREETEGLIRANLEQLRREKARDPDRKFITTIAEVKELYDQVRKTGVATTATSMNPILNPVVKALAAPIFDHRGLVVAALSTLGPADEFDEHPEGKLALELKAAADEISYELGYVPNVTPPAQDRA